MDDIERHAKAAIREYLGRCGARERWEFVGRFTPTKPHSAEGWTLLGQIRLRRKGHFARLIALDAWLHDTDGSLRWGCVVRADHPNKAKPHFVNRHPRGIVSGRGAVSPVEAFHAAIRWARQAALDGHDWEDDLPKRLPDVAGPTSAPPVAQLSPDELPLFGASDE